MTGTSKRPPSPTSRADEERPRHRVRVDMPTHHHNLPYTGHDQRFPSHTRESTSYRRGPSPAPTPVPAPPGDEEYARRLQLAEEYDPSTLNDRFERLREPRSGLRQPRLITVLSSDEERVDRPVRKEKISRWGPSTNDEGEKKKFVEPVPASRSFATPVSANERTPVVDLTRLSSMLDARTHAREKRLGLTPPASAPSWPSGINIPTPSRVSYSMKFDRSIPAPPVVSQKSVGLREGSSHTAKIAPTGSQFNYRLRTPTRASNTEIPALATGYNGNPSSGRTVRQMDAEDTILLQNRIRELEKRCKDAENAAAKSETAQVKMGTIANDLRVARDQITKELAIEKQKAVEAAAKSEAALAQMAKELAAEKQKAAQADAEARAARVQLGWDLATEKQKTEANERMWEKVDAMRAEYKKRHE